MSLVKVLVTGAGGFLGRALGTALTDRGAEVDGIDAETDLRDTSSIREVLSSCSPDAVVHLGGVSGPMVAADDPPYVTAVNAVGTANVLDACRRVTPSPRVVLASSVAVVEQRGASRATSVYAATKRFGEDIAAVFAASGLRVTVARIGSLYGPGRRTAHIITDLAGELRAAGRARIVRNAHEPLVHVDDAARSLARLALIEPVQQRPYYVVQQLLGHAAIAEHVAKALGMESQVEMIDAEPVCWAEPLDNRPLVADTGVDFAVRPADGIAALLDPAPPT